MVTMLRQSSSRNHRSKKLRPSHSFQAFLFFAVGVWIVYQLTRSHGKRQAVVVETNDGYGMDDGEPARRRLGRKGFFGFTGHASDDDIIVGVSDDVERGAASYDDPLNKDADNDGVGDDEDQAADEDDGADDSDDGLPADEEDDDSDSLSQNGNSEDELKTGESDRATVLGNGEEDGTRLHENSSTVLRMNATGRVQDVIASQHVNATDGGAAAHGSARLISDSALKNTSSVNLSSNDAGAESKKLNNVTAEDNRRISQNDTADSIGHGISR